MWRVLVTCILAAILRQKSAQGRGIQDRCGLIFVFSLPFYINSLPQVKNLEIGVVSFCLSVFCDSVSVVNQDGGLQGKCNECLLVIHIPSFFSECSLFLR